MYDTNEMEHPKLTSRAFPWFIREATTSDAEALMTYCNMMAQETPNNTTLRMSLLPQNVMEYRDLICHYCKHKHSCLFVVVDGARIVGQIKIDGNDHPLTAHVVELSINISPEYRGQGMGSALLQQAVDWARRRGAIRRVQLSVLARNQGAIRLYERMGFQVEGLRQGAYNLSDETGSPDEDAFVMGMLLEN
ncbi:MAG: GNAT family N-acetyltransferase [Anaerolineae bacterium]|nr:GNAT family N-acetyltransferase [Anaerolineae bacterium]